MRQRSARAGRLIVALDVTGLASAMRIARQLRGEVRTVKVGSVLFTVCGPEVIRRLRALGFDIMLDLKFFDIPNTVEQSCRAAVRHRVSMLTVHASGHPDMLRAAVLGARTEAKRLGVPRPLVLGVTVLTSTPPPATLAGGSATLGGQKGIASSVLKLAQRAFTAKCDGVVAAVQEAGALRKAFPKLKIVCPGIRPASAFRDDQRRVGTPAQALAAGADFLVVGRPVTAARHPRTAVHALLREMEAVDAC